MMREQGYYQSLIANRFAVSTDQIVSACAEIQQSTVIGENDFINLKLLEQLFLVLYEKLYPTTFGGIFEPLTKTIGFTHCHYIDPNKFEHVDHNQFWIRFNIFTNRIDGLPDSLQPWTISELVHVVHLLGYIKNNYYDKHVAPLTFANKEDYIGGRFEIHNNKLVITRNDDDAFAAYVNEEYILPYNACDFIIDDWTYYPCLTRNAQLFVDYLNIWGNEALKELVYNEFKLPEFRHYLRFHSHFIQVGPYTEELKNELSNIHFTKGIIKLQQETHKSRDDTIELYQVYIDEYAELNDYFDAVLYVSNALLGVDDQAFSSFNGELRQLMKMRYGDRMHDYSPDQYVGQIIPTPDRILSQLIETVTYHPGEKILFCIGLHGQTDGSATYAGGSFLKEHFEQMFELAGNYPNLQLLIMSCRSAKKTNRMVGNIIMNSSDQVSYVTYTDYFVESFRHGNSLYLAHLFAMMKYHQSLLPTSYVNQFGESIELCPIASDFHGKPSGI